jgi:hypothetical protein
MIVQQTFQHLDVERGLVGFAHFLSPPFLPAVARAVF